MIPPCVLHSPKHESCEDAVLDSCAQGKLQLFYDNTRFLTRFGWILQICSLESLRSVLLAVSKMRIVSAARVHTGLPICTQFADCHHLHMHRLHLFVS